MSVVRRSGVQGTVYTLYTSLNTRLRCLQMNYGDAASFWCCEVFSVDTRDDVMCLISDRFVLRRKSVNVLWTVRNATRLQFSFRIIRNDSHRAMYCRIAMETCEPCNFDSIRRPQAASLRRLPALNLYLWTACIHIQRTNFMRPRGVPMPSAHDIQWADDDGNDAEFLAHIRSFYEYECSVRYRHCHGDDCRRDCFAMARLTKEWKTLKKIESGCFSTQQCGAAVYIMCCIYIAEA